jgi:hypothetical protein
MKNAIASLADQPKRVISISCVGAIHEKTPDAEDITASLLFK